MGLGKALPFFVLAALGFYLLHIVTIGANEKALHGHDGPEYVRSHSRIVTAPR